MKLFKLFFLTMILFQLGFSVEAEASTRQDLELSKYMYEEIKNGNERGGVFQIDNTSLNLETGESLDAYFGNVFLQYPFGSSMWVYSTSFFGMCDKSTPNCKVDFSFEFYDTKDKIEEFNQQMKEFSEGLNGLDFQTKVAKITDYVKSTGEYGDNTIGSPHSAITFIKEGFGVCQAYATMTQRLLDYANIDNYLLTGWANGESHAWNVLYDEKGNQYHLDVTWEDTLNNGQYYMISTEQLSSYNSHMYLPEDLQKIKEAQQYFVGNLPQNGGAEPKPDNPTQEGIKDPDSSGHIPKALEDFINNIDKSKKVADLGIQPSDKMFQINFSSNVGDNYGDRVLMYNLDTLKAVELGFGKDGKSLIVKPKETLEKGKYYMIVLSGVKSNDDPPLVTKVDYFITFEVE